jgi:hypothetical protein
MPLELTLAQRENSDTGGLGREAKHELTVWRCNGAAAAVHTL